MVKLKKTILSGIALVLVTIANPASAAWNIAEKVVFPPINQTSIEYWADATPQFGADTLSSVCAKFLKESGNTTNTVGQCVAAMVRENQSASAGKLFPGPFSDDNPSSLYVYKNTTYRIPVHLENPSGWTLKQNPATARAVPPPGISWAAMSAFEQAAEAKVNEVRAEIDSDLRGLSFRLAELGVTDSAAARSLRQEIDRLTAFVNQANSWDLGEVKAKVDALPDRFNALEQRIGSVETRLETVEGATSSIGTSFWLSIVGFVLAILAIIVGVVSFSKSRKATAVATNAEETAEAANTAAVDATNTANNATATAASAAADALSAKRIAEEARTAAQNAEASAEAANTAAGEAKEVAKTAMEGTIEVHNMMAEVTVDLNADRFEGKLPTQAELEAELDEDGKTLCVKIDGKPITFTRGDDVLNGDLGLMVHGLGDELDALPIAFKVSRIKRVLGKAIKAGTIVGANPSNGNGDHKKAA